MNISSSGLLSIAKRAAASPLRHWLQRCSTARTHPFSTFNVASQARMNVSGILKKYKENTPLTMVTAYDYTSAMYVDRAGIDIALVGDSLAMVMLGRTETTTVTMEEVIHHSKAVSRGCSRTFVLADLPFGSVEVSNELAVQNAIRLVKEGRAMGVKIEASGSRTIAAVKAIVDAGIPVIGHVGLTPQTAPSHEGYSVQGKKAEQAAQIFKYALELQDAGCFGIVVESVPEPLAQQITDALSIPTFGIGGGRHTSGQVLVYHDILGLYTDFVPRFAKQYAKLSETIVQGLSDFKSEVEAKSFPAKEHTFSVKQEEWSKTMELIKQVSQEHAAQRQQRNVV